MKRKKISLIVLACLVFVMTFIPVSSAQMEADASLALQRINFTSATVNSQDVNLRTGPATKFTSICKLKKNQKVTVIGKLGDWYTVYVGSTGNVGAIYSKYLKLDKSTTSSAKQVSSSLNSGVSSKTTTSVKAKKVDVSKDEQALLDMVNKARKEKGLKALEFDADLVKIARLKAADMKNNNYFSHTSAYYGTPFDMMKKYEIKFSLAGENIAGNQTGEKAVKAWAEESSNNMYNGSFTYTGIGIVDSPAYGKLFVQMFIKK